MKIKNLKVSAKGIALLLSGTMALTMVSGCGNKQVLDLNKSFNIAIEENNGYVSVAAISAYSDYSGDQVQFVTKDNLRVLTSTHQTQLIKCESTQAINDYAIALASNDESKVMDYNKMQNISVDLFTDIWNKDVFDLHYTYDKAIILSDNTAIIVELESWKDYTEDDKIQLQFLDGTFILTNMDNIKLINDDEANEDSLHNYAYSLVGSEDNVVYYEPTKVKVKTI